ncbi:MAG: hypothetical protein NZ699_04485 [Roseiflexus sp.]|nr:hypothetical protein [Roseiflexus sp.]MCS7288370.1 hypothetical protein [Roseiflexus sp.]MDW8146520.1 hypothetical protein [Roseiflexaceae bacterium]MDW8231201.1 hypothetical protein [Roseiflexaceae bacterium]
MSEQRTQGAQFLANGFLLSAAHLTFKFGRAISANRDPHANSAPGVRVFQDIGMAFFPLHRMHGSMGRAVVRR